MRLPNFSNKPKKLISYRYLLFLNDHGIISDMINVIEQLKPFQLKKIDISSSNFVRVVPPRLWRKLMHEEIWKWQVVSKKNFKLLDLFQIFTKALYDNLRATTFYWKFYWTVRYYSPRLEFWLFFLEFNN